MKNKFGLFIISVLLAFSGVGCNSSEKNESEVFDDPIDDPISEDDVGEDGHTHDYGRWETKIEPTFETEGEEHRFCSICNHEQIRPIDKVPHNFSKKWSYDAEKHWHACIDEGYETLKKDEATHEFDELFIFKQPTNGETGLGNKECKKCHYIIEEVVPALGYGVVTKHDAIAPTCTKEGQVEFYTREKEPGIYYADEDCTIKITTITVSPTGHKNVSKHDGIPSTCTTSGQYQYFTCENEPGVYYADENCTVVLNDLVVPPKGHRDVTKHEACAPTCNKPGNIEYFTCANEPGIYFADESCTTSIDPFTAQPTGHGVVTEHKGTPPTCTEPGSFDCYTCSKEPGIRYANEECTIVLESVVRPALGHQKSENYTSDNEYHWFICLNNPTEQLEKEKHNFGDTIVIVAPTSDQNGEGIKKCTDCGKSVVTKIPALGLGKVTKHEAVEPTCVDDGVIEYYTAENKPGIYYSDEGCVSEVTNLVAPALGHDPIYHEYKAPTCTKPGNEAYYSCSREEDVCYADYDCSIKLDDIDIPATGHGTISKHEKTDPTCLNGGNIEYYSCSNEPDVYYADETLEGTYETVIIPATGHGTIITYDAVAPTCTEGGNILYFTCSKEPGVYYRNYNCTDKVDNPFLSALGHQKTTTYLSDDTHHWFTCENDNTEVYDKEEHIDQNGDHKCDTCNEWIPGLHIDSDKNHFCDVCEEFIGKHTDGDTVNHICEYCSKEIDYLHSDLDHNHICDVCSANLGEHIDKNNDHYCDICDEPTDHFDTNKDHYCDLCGEQMSKIHYDYDYNHICDLCGAETEHNDSNGDHVCDTCLKQLPYVSGSIIYSCRKIKVGETINVSSSVTGYNGSSSKVHFGIKGGYYDLYTLLDNGDGTASITFNKWGSAVSLFRDTYLYLYSDIDNSELDGIHIYGYRDYESAEETKLLKIFPSIDLVPYITQCSFEQPTDSNTKMKGESFEPEGVSGVAGAFINNGNYVYFVENDEYYFYRSANEDKTKIYEVHVYADKDNTQKTHIDFQVLNSSNSNFPTSLIAKLFANNDASKIPVPNDGNSYQYYVSGNTLQIFNNSIYEDYKTCVINKGYTFVENDGEFETFVSSDRTIVLKIGDGLFKFSKQEPKEQAEWNDYSKNLMNEKIGEVLPFVNAEYNEWYEADSKILAKTNSADASCVAQEVFDLDNNFTKGEDGQYIKELDNNKALIVEITSNFISAYLTGCLSKTWKSNDVNSALTKTSATLPEIDLPQSGSVGFNYEISQEKVIITVDGDSSTLTNYVSKLISNNFTFELEIDDTTSRYASTDGSLRVEIKKNTDAQFVVTAYTHLPFNQYSEFPIDEISSILGVDCTYDFVDRGGSLYSIKVTGTNSLELSIKEGDKYDYMLSLILLGWQHNGNEFTLENVKVVVTESAGNVVFAISLIA